MSTPSKAAAAASPDLVWRASVNKRFGDIDEKLSANTRMTAETRDELRAFIARAEPTLEVTEPMLRGAALMGKIVTFAHRWGARVTHAALIGVGLWVGFKILVAGGGWAEAVDAFGRIAGK